MRGAEVVVRGPAGGGLAKEDVGQSAGCALPSTSVLFEVVAFHAQQAAVKALKAFRVWHQVEFPKTHDISRLLALGGSVESDLRESLADAEEHDTFAERRRAMTEWMVRRYDWSVVRPQLDALLLTDSPGVDPHEVNAPGATMPNHRNDG